MLKSLLLLLLTIFLNADVGTLIEIVDGDTLNFKTNSQVIKCRIEYIDTPESSNNKKLKKDISKCKNISTKDMKSAGKSATRAAQRLLTLNKQYEYDVNGKDHYGRSICVVKLDGTTFNEQMVLDGYAVPYRQYLNKSELRHYENILGYFTLFFHPFHSQPSTFMSLKQASKIVS